MLVERSMHREVELTKWLVLAVLAAALATLLAASVAGAEEYLPGAEPGRFPPEMGRLARPMIQPAANAELADHLTPEAALPISKELWLVVEQHAQGTPYETRATWQRLSLPVDAAVWRELGLALSSMQLADLDAASLALAKAQLLAPENPLVHYFVAILNLERALAADEYYDAIGPSTTRVAGYLPEMPMLRQTKSMYQLLAMQDLEQAIELRNNVFLEETLLPSYLLPANDAAPTVGDLLRVWKAENFAAQAHNMLGSLCLERGLLEQAEDHMDQAKASGARVLYGYRDLGARYEEQHRYGEAFRAYAKAMGEDPSVAAPTQGMLRNLGQALEVVW
jgi:tetratricopeptide (TPR) repeat protein